MPWSKDRRKEAEAIRLAGTNRLCCVPLCDYNTLAYWRRPGAELRSMHKFPYDPQRKLKWIENIQRRQPDGTAWEPVGASRVCSAHFTDACFLDRFIARGAKYRDRTRVNRHLASFSIPTVFAGYPPDIIIPPGARHSAPYDTKRGRKSQPPLPPPPELVEKQLQQQQRREEMYEMLNIPIESFENLLNEMEDKLQLAPHWHYYRTGAAGMMQQHLLNADGSRRKLNAIEQQLQDRLDQQDNTVTLTCLNYANVDQPQVVGWIIINENLDTMVKVPGSIVLEARLQYIIMSGQRQYRAAIQAANAAMMQADANDLLNLANPNEIQIPAVTGDIPQGQQQLEHATGAENPELEQNTADRPVEVLAAEENVEIGGENAQPVPPAAVDEEVQPEQPAELAPQQQQQHDLDEQLEEEGAESRLVTWNTLAMLVSEIEQCTQANYDGIDESDPSYNDLISSYAASAGEVYRDGIVKQEYDRYDEVDVKPVIVAVGSVVEVEGANGQPVMGRILQVTARSPGAGDVDRSKILNPTTADADSSEAEEIYEEEDEDDGDEMYSPHHKASRSGGGAYWNHLPGLKREDDEEIEQPDSDDYVQEEEEDDDEEYMATIGISGLGGQGRGRGRGGRGVYRGRGRGRGSQSLQHQQKISQRGRGGRGGMWSDSKISKNVSPYRQQLQQQAAARNIFGGGSQPRVAMPTRRSRQFFTPPAPAPVARTLPATRRGVANARRPQHFTLAPAPAAPAQPAPGFRLFGGRRPIVVPKIEPVEQHQPMSNGYAGRNMQQMPQNQQQQQHGRGRYAVAPTFPRMNTRNAAAIYRSPQVHLVMGAGNEGEENMNYDEI